MTTIIDNTPAQSANSSVNTSSVNVQYFLNDTIQDKTIAANAASMEELQSIVETFYKDVREFSRKAKKYAAAIVINTIARRNMSGFALFYSKISSCGDLGKKIANDAFAGLQTACQENGKYEVSGKSFAVKKVKTKDGQKTVEFSFKEVKSSVWTSALKFAKTHKAEILTFRLPKEDKAPLSWLDKACALATTWNTAREKALTGSESSVQAEQLERLNKQLDRLSDPVRKQVLEALTILSSVELPE